MTGWGSKTKTLMSKCHYTYDFIEKCSINKYFLLWGLAICNTSFSVAEKGRTAEKGRDSLE